MSVLYCAVFPFGGVSSDVACRVAFFPYAASRLKNIASASYPRRAPSLLPALEQQQVRPEQREVQS